MKLKYSKNWDTDFFESETQTNFVKNKEKSKLCSFRKKKPKTLKLQNWLFASVKNIRAKVKRFLALCFCVSLFFIGFKSRYWILNISLSFCFFEHSKNKTKKVSFQIIHIMKWRTFVDLQEATTLFRLCHRRTSAWCIWYWRNPGSREVNVLFRLFCEVKLKKSERTWNLFYL